MPISALLLPTVYRYQHGFDLTYLPFPTQKAPDTFIGWAREKKAGTNGHSGCTTRPPPMCRPDQTGSVSMFSMEGHKGVGSYFQEPVQAGEWIHVVGIADGQSTFIYKNGVFKLSQSYAGVITPQHGAAPMRMATRDFKSFFLGSIRGVRIWNRVLTAAEVQMVFTNTIPQDGLVVEYRLEQDIVPDDVGLHNGQIFGGVWTS